MTIWEPPPGWVEATNVWRFMRRLGFSRLDDFLRYSRQEVFWDELAYEIGIEWAAPYTRVLDDSRGPEWARWFVDGKLNIARNCLERHTGPACLWEGEDGSTRQLSFEELNAEASRLANALEALGLAAGDRVALLMPMIPEVISVLYGCFKLGLTAVPIFAGYGADAIQTRLADCGPRVVVTADFLERRGIRLPLKEKLDDVLPPSVEHVIVCRYKGGEVPWDVRRDLWWDELLAAHSFARVSVPLDSETRALILYTSGTTGQPKGAVHTHAGALIQTAKEIWLGFDHRPDDRFFWLSDIGWMMGPWEIIGNHHFGGAVFLYDGAPDYPQGDRLWSLVERHRITTLGLSPTAVRVSMRHCPDGPALHDFSSLRLLGSTGEPWDETSYRWLYERTGRRPIINISGGTEIIGCFLMPMPIQPLKPCTLGGPAPGMAVEVREGTLVCTRPAPSMTRGLWNAPERYIETYWSRWPGVWYHGDRASVDEDGYWFLHGRADESLKVAGRKVGPAEIEEALIRHPAVSEAAVVGVPDEITGEAIVAFVVLKQPAQPRELAQHVADRMGAAFRPKRVIVVDELPKTQSGKIIRRELRER